MSDITKFNTLNSIHNKWSKYILIFLAALIVILVIWCICLVIGSIGTVKNITVQGEVPYADEHIIAVSNIEQGAKIKHIDFRNVEETILECLPCISNVSVKKKADGEVVIRVTPEEIRYVANICGQRYVMSDKFRVLCIYGDVALEKDLLEIALPTVKRAIIGQTIEYFDDSKYIDDLVDILIGTKLSDGINFVDFSDKYNLKLLYKNKYNICLGDLDDINLKLQKVYMILEDDMLAGDNKAIIDVSDISHPTVKILS